MEYVHIDDERIGLAVHIIEVLKCGLVLIDEAFRGNDRYVDGSISPVFFNGIKSISPIFEGYVAIYDCKGYGLSDVSNCLFESLGYKLSFFKSEVSEEVWDSLEDTVNRLKDMPVYFQFK